MEVKELGSFHALSIRLEGLESYQEQPKFQTDRLLLVQESL